MGGVVTEEKVISRVEYLDLVYSQTGTLYDLIPHAHRSLNDPSRMTLESHVDGMVGSLKIQYETQANGKQSHTSSTLDSSQIGTKYAPSTIEISEVNVVQSTSSQQPGGKKKNKGKSKNSSN
jgi:hypothetical protein